MRDYGAYQLMQDLLNTAKGYALAAVAPFTIGGKLNLGTPNRVGHLPPDGGGTGHEQGAEPPLGYPAADGYVLSSTVPGVRSWVPPGGLTAEQVRDLVAAFAVAGANVTIAHDDAGDTLTFAVDVRNAGRWEHLHNGDDMFPEPLYAGADPVYIWVEAPL